MPKQPADDHQRDESAAAPASVVHSNKPPAVVVDVTPLAAPNPFYNYHEDKAAYAGDADFWAQRKINRLGTSERDFAAALARSNDGLVDGLQTLSMADRMHAMVGAPVSSESMANHKVNHHEKGK